MYLQGDNKQFGKFVGYGCWCLSGADMDLGEPSGEPVDAIDRACRQDWYTYSRDPQVLLVVISVTLSILTSAASFFLLSFVKTN